MAIIIIGLIFIKNQNETKLEASSAFGAALVAYSNADFESAKFQFESISNSYEGTESEILSNYYLGKIAYELGNFNEAKIFLNDFLEEAEKATFVCGAIKQLVDISIQENDLINSFDIIAKARNFKINNVSKLELKLLEINTFIKVNDLRSAEKAEIEEILKDEKLPPYIKDEINEFEALL